jgi:hypothetical protein
LRPYFQLYEDISMTIAAHETQEDKYKWLMRPFMWAFDACILPLPSAFGLWTGGLVPVPYVIAGLMLALIVAAGFVGLGIIRMRTAYDGRL